MARRQQYVPVAMQFPLVSPTWQKSKAAVISVLYRGWSCSKTCVCREPTIGVCRRSPMARPALPNLNTGYVGGLGINFGLDGFVDACF
jgi:hypothetical protein